ncbi:MAG: HNH endonuclease signature motif containing protein [Microbacteriaceae bacterium]
MKNPAAALEAITGDLAGMIQFDGFTAFGDESLLQVTGAIERLGRRVDALRVAAAAEIAERSRPELGKDGLAAGKGCRSASELLQRITLASGATVDRWLGLGKPTRARISLAGERIPAQYSRVARALAAGEISHDAALTIVRGLNAVRDKAGIGQLDAAEHELVAAATGIGPDSNFPCTADETRIHTLTWQARLDQDGRLPDDETVMRQRGFGFGRERDGLVPVRGALLPEIAGKFSALFDACMSPRTGPAFLSEEEIAAREREHDPRTPDQQRHDILAGIVDIAARSGQLPTVGGAAPTVLVSVRQRDLEAGRGVGYLDGVITPLSMRAVKQFTCTGGTQAVVLADTGRIIALGSPQRCFTAQQRRAITLRDGGCIIPGCQIPASWCEIHHVQPAVDGGITHTDNGVLLCWFHHRTIETSGWCVRMAHGAPQVKAPPWLDRSGTWRPAARSRTALMDTVEYRTAEYCQPQRR